MLYKAGLPQLSIDWMLGHRIKNRVTEAYFKPDPETLENHYIKALPYLTVEEKVEVRVVTDERLREMEEGRKQDQKRIDELEKIIKRRYQIEQVPPTNGE
jgi:hypothetical protein